ncbi:hypothetical protein MKX01_021525 [Papaver californicum]|nr:hypothetical protein MKX01_021525 [Papaver californicum]
MKSLFKSKPKKPAELVRLTRELLILADTDSTTKGTKRDEKMAELSKLIRDLKCVLYGNGESEPLAEACAQLTQEFFKRNTLRLIIICLPKLNLEELLTRHKSTVADFLTKNYDWFFAEYNEKLLESSNYIIRRQSVKLLGDMLLDRSNSPVMMKYVCSKDNLRILMNLLRESSKNIPLEAFHVFKLFAANQNKHPEIVGILVANRSKLLRFFSEFKIDKEDEQFEADKAQVIKEIVALEPKDRS